MDPNLTADNYSYSYGGGSYVGGDLGDSSTSIMATLLNAGLGAYRSQLAADVASRQQTGSSSLLLLILAVVVVVVVVKH